MSYSEVTEALKHGVDPAMLCETCPWDRFCVQPPAMTTAKVEEAIEMARQKDREESKQRVMEGKGPGAPVGSLVTLATMLGRDTSGPMCPVFTLRLRSSAGRRVVDVIRETMQNFDDQA